MDRKKWRSMGKILVSFICLCFNLIPCRSVAQAKHDLKVNEITTYEYCDCFEAVEKVFGSPFYSVQIVFGADSVATATIIWKSLVVEKGKIPINSPIFRVSNSEYFMESADISLINDTILKANYILPELAYASNLQPQNLILGEYNYIYNRLVNNSQGLLCGEFAIQHSELR